MTQRNVLILAFLFPPTAAVGSFRTLRFVKYLPEFGWNPLVVAARTECTGYSSDATLTAQIPATVTIERTGICSEGTTLSDVFRRVFRTPRIAGQEIGAAPAHHHSTHARSGACVQLLRTVRDRLFFTPDPCIAWSRPAIRASLEAVRHRDIDVLYSTSPPHSTHVIALRLKLMTGLPWVADFRDPWSNSPGLKDARKAGKRRVAERLERRCVTAADCVVLNTQSSRDEFVNCYTDIPEDKFVCIPNGVDPGHLSMIADLCKGVKLRLDGKLRICHPGSLYGRRNARPFLAAMKRLVDGGANVVFEQVGSIDEGFALERFIAEQGLDNNVSVRGKVDHCDALRAMADADVLLILQPGTSTQVPAKLYEMMAFGKPILALTGPGATANLVTRYGLGVVVDPNDVEAISVALRRTIEVAANHTLDHRVALAAFDGRALTGQLAKTLNACTNTSSHRTG